MKKRDASNKFKNHDHPPTDRYEAAVADVDAQSAARSHQPQKNGTDKRNRNLLDVVGESSSNVDFERDSRQILDSVGLKSENPSSESQVSKVALSNVKSVQLQRLVLLTQQQLKEIRSYTANEIFKTRKQTNKLFAEF